MFSLLYYVYCMSRQLNNKQITTLQLILRFRYVTADNLANARNITHHSAYSALEILKNTGYLGKIHDKSYRLLNKSARYFLTPQALIYLRDLKDSKIDKALLLNRRYEDRRSQDFIDYQVAIHSAYIELSMRFGEDKVFVATDLVGTEGIIKPLPGLYVKNTDSNHFFVELVDGQHLFLAKKRIRKYIENYDNNEWEWDSYPSVYFVRSSANDRSRLKKYIETQMDDAYLDADDFSIYIVSKISNIPS